MEQRVMLRVVIDDDIRKVILNERPDSIEELKTQLRDKHLFSRFSALFTKTQVFAEFNRIASRNLEGDFNEALDKHAPRLIDLFKSRKGTMGKKTDKLDAAHQLGGNSERRSTRLSHSWGAECDGRSSTAGSKHCTSSPSPLPSYLRELPPPSFTMSLPSSLEAGAEFHSNSTSPLSLDSSVFFSETAASSIRDQLNFFTINVGGSRYVLSQELLTSFPETRLGKLACCSRDSALELCDDADLLENEFFFDRNSQTFQYVMNFYRTGHLHVSEDFCEISFLQEIQYWGIDELRIKSCCRERYYRRKEQKESFNVRPEFQAKDDEEDFVGAACPAFRQHLWDLLEKPESSRAARTFGSLSVFFVVVSVVNMVLISLDLEEDVGLSGVGVAAPLLFDTLEYVCVMWFTGELALRFLCVRDKCRFTRSVPNVIDLLAILPFYVTLAVENLHGGSTELENMGRVVQVLRLLRSLRMLKLGRHSTGLKSLGLTIAQCYEEVGLLLLFLGVGISIFATVVFTLEHEFPSSTFSSVPAAWWWATTSMTTVGYGDIRPDTTVGRVLAFLCILSGILILALPIAIINERFSACYFTLKMKEATARHGEMLKRLARGSVGGVNVGTGVNLRDAYARSVLEMMRLHGRERASTRSSGGEELWW